jgi:hypothetical protein
MTKQSTLRVVTIAPRDVVEWVELLQLFGKTVEFYIRVDNKNGDAEGAALKAHTLGRIHAALRRAGAL